MWLLTNETAEPAESYGGCYCCSMTLTQYLLRRGASLGHNIYNICDGMVLTIEMILNAETSRKYCMSC